MLQYPRPLTEGRQGVTIAPRKPAKKDVASQAVAQLEGQLTIEAALEGLEGALDRESPDWTALEAFNLGELVDVLLRADAGIMLRSGDHGRAVSIGVFVGGRSQWITCRDQRDALAILDACVGQLVGIAESAVSVGVRTRRTRRS